MLRRCCGFLPFVSAAMSRAHPASQYVIMKVAEAVYC